MGNLSVDFLLERLRRELPPIVTRRLACKFLGGAYTPAGLANMDCAGEGPGGYRLGKVVVYDRETFLEWLSGRFGGGEK